MVTTANKLLYLQDTKIAIKDAIEAKGVSVPVGTPFRDYATKIDNIATGGSSEPEVVPWVRDASWLSLPNNINGVQKVSILNAVFDTDGEYVAFTCSGNYTVDWGDGTSENFASGIKAEHKYDYSNVNLNSNKSEYKQAVITITPQSGQNLTSVSLCDYHSVLGASSIYKSTCNFLEVKVNSSMLTNFRLNYTTSGVSYYFMPLLESFILGEHSITRFDYLFKDCTGLENLSFLHTNNIFTYASAFMNCFSLQVMPTLALNVTTSLNNAFNYCRSLVKIQDIILTNTSNDDLVSAFNSCSSLRKINLTINTNSSFSLNSTFSGCSMLEECNISINGNGTVSDLSVTFSACYSLRSAPYFSTRGCNLFTSMFNACINLIEVPSYNYAGASSLSNMFNGCVSLRTVPNFNTTTSLSTLANMFAGCLALVHGATFTDTTKVTTISGMYNNCSNMTYVPSYSFPAIVAAANTVFGNCYSLISVPNINLGNPTSITSILSNMFSLKRMKMPLKYSFTVAQSKMSATALNEMYTMLPTVTGKTVTITGSLGASGDDPSIAVAKGWTVTG